MISRTNTSTSLILMGLTTPIANSFASTSVKEYGSYEEIVGIESFYSTPKDRKSRIESYVDSAYRKEVTNSAKYSTIEGAFFHIVQDFADTQIELEREFYNVMDDLLVSKINNLPSKKRF